jgi:hypothetical protein
MSLVGICLIGPGGGCAGRGVPPVAIAQPRQEAAAASKVQRESESATSALQIRAQSYWGRRQAKDLSGAYSFYCSAYKARVPLAEFLQMTRLTRFDLKDARVTDLKPSGDSVEVVVNYRFVMPTLADQLLDGQTSERWARDSNGEWCKPDEPIVLPFPPQPVAPR